MRDRNRTREVRELYAVCIATGIVAHLHVPPGRLMARNFVQELGIAVSEPHLDMLLSAHTGP